MVCTPVWKAKALPDSQAYSFEQLAFDVISFSLPEDWCCLNLQTQLIRKLDVLVNYGKQNIRNFEHFKQKLREIQRMVMCLGFYEEQKRRHKHCFRICIPPINNTFVTTNVRCSHCHEVQIEWIAKITTIQNLNRFNTHIREHLLQLRRRLRFFTIKRERSSKTIFVVIETIMLKNVDAAANRRLAFLLEHFRYSQDFFIACVAEILARVRASQLDLEIAKRPFRSQAAEFQGIVPWDPSLLISRLQNSCVPRSGTYLQYFSQSFSIAGPGISSNGNGVLSTYVVRGTTLAAGISPKLSGAISEFAVSSSGIAFDDITVALTADIAWGCVTEAAGDGKNFKY
ncbi:hypothetical protein X777_10851 [Ooceraea biroi]|uniref:Uncharacterized protein n=1 Tax=Ooceraea biroi TaxID=2015173 RepID=A0A026W4A4_OOCBI|nr:hypothetical protein X777_10851 [Ooceraea biroi]